MYIIIIGAGDIGTPLIDVATRSGNDVVVERDDERANAAATEYDCMVLNADATTKETLEDAGADRADALISTTQHDATNVMVCLLAKEFEIPAVLSVVHNREHMNLFRQIGVNTMENPEELIAEHLYRAVSRPCLLAPALPPLPSRPGFLAPAFSPRPSRPCLLAPAISSRRARVGASPPVVPRLRHDQGTPRPRA